MSLILNQLGEKFLVIKKPRGEKLEISLTDLYVKHSIQLDIAEASHPDMTSSMVYRVSGNELYQKRPRILRSHQLYKKMVIQGRRKKL